MADRPPLTITIDGIAYPCSSWQTSSAARTLERRYDSGFNGGMGFFTEKQAAAPNQIYNCVNLDPTTFPYIRMRKGERNEVTLTLTGADSGKPAYGFVEEDSGNVEYLYLVNAARSFKIDLGANGTARTPALESTTQPTGFSGGEVGRPVRFEGTWYVPLGDGAGNPNARKLTVVGVGDQTNDTWADVGVKSRHFGTMMFEDQGVAVAQIWRAYSTNLIQASSDGSSFSGGSEVGDSSFGISDILNLSGELFISKPDAPYRFDSQGVSKKVMEFVGATGGYLTNFTGEDGANSGVHGPYGYWCHSTGLWRIWGDSALPIGPDAPPNWTPINLDSMTSAPLGWFSFAAWGRWAYAMNSQSGLHVGWIETDGTIRWMGNIVAPAETNWDALARMGITTTSTAPILWILDTNERFAIFDLELDGSLRQIATDGGASTDRGADNERGQIWMPGTDFGEPEKQKRIRMMWLDIDNNEYANVDIEARIHRDRITSSIQLGSAVTSADGPGHFEFIPVEKSTAITSSSTANPSVLTVTAHGFISGEIVTIAGHSSTPDINGEHVATWLSANTFSIPVDVTAGGGAAGTAASNRDTCYEVMPAIRFDTNQASAFDPDPADPRIRAFGIRAVTPHTYTAILPVTKDGMTGSLGVKDAIIKLRALKSGEGVAVKEPGFNFTFTGYIKDVQEKVIDVHGSEPDYAVEVTIDRWVI